MVYGSVCGVCGGLWCFMIVFVVVYGGICEVCSVLSCFGGLWWFSGCNGNCRKDKK